MGAERTGWPRRRGSDFAATKLGQAFRAARENLVEHHAQSLADKLKTAHAELVKRFFADANKAQTDAPLTNDEYAAFIAAIVAMSGDDYATAIYDAQRILAEGGVAAARGLIRGSVADIQTGFDVLPSYVLDGLKSGSTELGLKVVGREQDTLRGILSDAFTNGWSVPQTTQAIHDAFDAGYHVNDNLIIPSDSWAEMVARTELSDAANQGAMAAYQEAGIQKLEWVAQMGLSTCDECQAADGEQVNTGDDFPEVDVPDPPAHPRCVCTTIPADEDLGDFSGTEEQRNTAIRGGYSADEYEAKFGVRHPIDQ